jgi:hypothetical protein
VWVCVSRSNVSKGGLGWTHLTFPVLGHNIPALTLRSSLLLPNLSRISLGATGRVPSKGWAVSSGER